MQAYHYVATALSAFIPAFLHAHFPPHMHTTTQLLLLPDFSETSAYYASRVEANPADISLIEPCLPRSTGTTTDPPCDDIIFALSVEFYGQVYGKCL